MSKLWKFLFRDHWHQCHPMTDAERLAAFEIRMGKWRASERMRDHRVAQVLDSRAVVRPKVTPKLPSDNVIQLRRKRA